MQILGVHIDSPFVHSALVLKVRGEIEVRSLRSALISDPKNVKQLYIENFKGRIATGISAKDLLVRSFELNVIGNKHIEKALAFQSEATSHFDPTQVISVPLLKKRQKSLTEALLFTVPRETIKSHLSQLGSIQIEPDNISAVCLALCRFVRWKIPGLFDAFIVDLSSSEWTCIWMEKGELKRCYVISGGTEALLKSLWEDRKKILLQNEIEGVAKQIDLMQLKPHLNPHLTGKLNELRQELAKVIYSFHRSADLKPILFTGRSDAFGHLREFLMDSFKSAICSECKGACTTDEQKFAISIGLALEQTSSPCLQLRREEFFLEKNWKRLGTYAISALIISLLLTAFLFNLGNRSILFRKKAMVASLENSLDLKLRNKIFSEVDSQEEIINRWISAVETHNKEYPYILQAPKVAEVLSWLFAHPLLDALKKEGDPIRIRDFRYQLLQFPRIGFSKEPYRTKVEIEFQFQSAMHARKFHEALLKGDEKVDPNLEITWDVLNEGYRTSFFLKNRSPHVP